MIQIIKLYFKELQIHLFTAKNQIFSHLSYFRSTLSAVRRFSSFVVKISAKISRIVLTFLMCLYSLNLIEGSVFRPIRDLDGDSLGDLDGDLDADLSLAVIAGV